VTRYVSKSAVLAALFAYIEALDGRDMTKARQLWEHTEQLARARRQQQQREYENAQAWMQRKRADSAARMAAANTTREEA
jgi:hypothetical protein